MKRRFLISCTTAVVTIMGLLCGQAAAFASTGAASPDTEKGLNIVTVDSRPLFVDKLLYTAFKDIDYHVSFTVAALQDGYNLANNADSDGDGVIAATPGIEETYTNLIRVPIVLDQVLINALVREDSGISAGSWDDLSGLNVGLLTQRAYIESHIPSDAKTFAYMSSDLLLKSLANGECDVAILAVRAHETFIPPEGIATAGRLDSFPEYLYLNKKNAGLVSDITSALSNMFSDGRAGNILNDIPVPGPDKNKTILHIISSNAEGAKEDQFKKKLMEQFADDETIEWYTMPLYAKRFLANSNRLASVAQLLRQDCVSRDIAAIIVSGDDALDFVEKYYFLLFRNIPVLFSGISTDRVEGTGRYKEHFTGIVEHVSAFETVSLALELFPNTKNIYVLNDYTSEGYEYRTAVAEQIVPFEDRVDVEYNENIGRDQLLSDIRKLPADSILLVGSYARDGNGQYFTMNDMKRGLESACSVPIFSLYTAEVGYNAIGGKAPDYEMYGDVVGEMLKRLLEGENVADIPVITDSSMYNRWVFDENIMRNFNIKERSLPDDSQILNRRLSIWESDPRFAITLLIVVILGVAAAIAINAFLYKYRKQTEQLRMMDAIAATQQSLQTIIDTMPVPIRIVDCETASILYVNHACLVLFGFEKPEDMCGKPIADLVAKEQKDSADPLDMIAHLLGIEDTDNMDINYLTAGGETVEAHITACAIDYKGRKGTLGIIKDLTAEKEYERMLLNTAQKEKEANQLKSRFLVNMSHEIRTPMNAIIGLTEIELRKNPDKEVEDTYKKINTSAKNLLDIINDILDLSKIEADKMEIFSDEFELEEVISSAMLVAGPRLDGKSVEFILNASLGLPRFVINDRTRLWQILKNFLDNSAKYTENGKIVLTVFTDNKLSDDETIWLTFIIEDTGIGINEEQLQKIFMPYEQIYNNAQRKYTGTGLGMAISKQLCELMGGNMQIESKIGEGTTVRLNIPFKRSENPETELNLVKSHELSGVKILAVDDDELSLSIMSELISGSNAGCDLARSGQEALEIILEHRDRGEAYDLILLDYMMDGLNGLETARKIQTGLSRAPKLLMVTAYQRLLLKKELEKYNIADVIEKPFIPSQFVSKICAVLGLDDHSSRKPDEKLARFRDAEVLLCEDYRLNQEIAVGMLEQFGVAATIAENGRHGIDILNTGKAFDLILMDLQMPVMDGYEATRTIRADKRFDHIPIVSLTADAMKEITDRCMEMGMDDHIAKPIEFNKLQDVLIKWIPESKRVLEDIPAEREPDPSNSALMRFGGRKDRYEKALCEFAETLYDEWPDFDSAVQDMDETKRYVHKIKGAAGNLSEMEIYHCCKRFESSLRDGAPDKGLYEQLIGASESFKRKVAAQTKNSGEPSAENNAEASEMAGTAEELAQILGTLGEALDKYDLKRISDRIGSLQEKTWPAEYGEKLRQLYGFVEDYNYDDAINILKTIGVKINE